MKETLKKNWPTIIKPVVVLTVICIVASLVLAVVNGKTAPVIEETTRKAQNAARLEVMPDAADFEKMDYTSDICQEIYKATNGVGYVATCSADGYEGKPVTVTVAIGADGTITGIKVDASTQSAGIGTKVGESSFYQQFIGQSTSGALSYGSGVDAVANATFSSNAVLNAVNAAIEAYNAVK